MTLEETFQKFERPTHLDMKVNFKKFLESETLGKKNAGIVALACASARHITPLVKFLEAHLKTLDASDVEIQEAKDVAAVMNVANVYYRFRHYVEKPAYQKPAGFRMSLMAKPTIGKLAMEMAALAVSAINGCENCCVGHEKSVLEHGGTEDQVHDVIRIAAAVNGIAPIFSELNS